MKKKRLDEILVERHLAENIDIAKRLIMAGVVFSKTERLDKAGMLIPNDTPLTVKHKTIPYVSRGGLKLEKALSFFSIDPKDRVLVDIGASTGGFTDCALQNGARLSYAIDVGYNQLDWKLRNDERVVVMERTNFRYVSNEMFKKGKPNLATIDVSFISLIQILPVLRNILLDDSDVIALIKPQFEAKKEQVGEKGIIRDSSVHHEVIHNILDFANEQGFQILNLTFSPITGGEGNIEFLVHLGWKKESTPKEFSIEEVIEQAHTALIN